MDAPGVRRAINMRATGDPERPVAIALAERFRERWPVSEALAIGCGTGELERFAVAELGVVSQFHGIDIAPGAIEIARARAESAGLTARLSYEVADAAAAMRAALASGREYDLIVFNFVLHHLENLESVLDLTLRLLRRDPPGLVFLDEYVGPARHEWTEEELGFASGLFARVPRAMRRTERVWPPLAIEDESEMIRSSEIESLVAERFEILERRPYFGNILHPLVCAIRPECLATPEVRSILEQAVQLEDYLANRGLLRSHFVAMLCTAP